MDDEPLTTFDDYLSDGELLNYVFRRLILIDAACTAPRFSHHTELTILGIRDLTEEIYSALSPVRDFCLANRPAPKGGA
jgi:hypothetical protein